MRDALCIDKGIDILDYVHSLPEKEQEEAQEKLRKIEKTAMLDMEAQPGIWFRSVFTCFVTNSRSRFD